MKIFLQNLTRSFVSLSFLCIALTPLSADTFTVTNSAESGPGSLAQAITDANALSGADTIAFNIPGTGVHTITLTDVLPAITDDVTMDG